MEGDCDIDQLQRHGGDRVAAAQRARAVLPEIDRPGWFALPIARKKILPAHAPLLDRLEDLANA